MTRLGGGVEGTVYRVSDKLVKKVWHKHKNVDYVKGMYSLLKERMKKVSRQDVKLVAPKKYYVKKNGQVVTYSKYIPKKTLYHEPFDVKRRWFDIERELDDFGIGDLHTGNVIYYKNKWYIVDARAY